MTGRAHKQNFAYDIFSLPHKNRVARFSANTFVTKTSGKFSYVHKQIKIVTKNLAKQNVLVSTMLKDQIFYRGRKVRRKSSVIQLIVVVMNCARSHRRKCSPIALVLF